MHAALRAVRPDVLPRNFHKRAIPLVAYQQGLARYLRFGACGALLCQTRLLFLRVLLGADVTERDHHTNHLAALADRDRRVVHVQRRAILSPEHVTAHPLLYPLRGREVDGACLTGKIGSVGIMVVDEFMLRLAEHFTRGVAEKPGGRLIDEDCVAPGIQEVHTVVDGIEHLLGAFAQERYSASGGLIGGVGHYPGKSS